MGVVTAQLDLHAFNNAFSKLHMAFLLNAAYALIIWHNQKASTFLSCHRGIASARWSIGARLSQQKSGASIRRSLPHKPDCSQFTGLKHVFRQFQFHLDIEQRCLSIAQSRIFFLKHIPSKLYLFVHRESSHQRFSDFPDPDSGEAVDPRKIKNTGQIKKQAPGIIFPRARCA